jgi:hypothetical protein
MNLLFSLTHNLLTFFAAVFITIGLKNQRINYVISALWLSLIAIVLHYQSAGGEILGSYFSYHNSLLYSLNLIILTLSLIYLFFKLPFLKYKWLRFLTTLASAFIVTGTLIILINLWTNAFFIENRQPDTPIMQIATLKPLDYCQYKYVFYRFDKNGGISYLCPNYYLIFPSTAHLNVSPNFLRNHLSQKNQKKSAIKYKKK